MDAAKRAEQGLEIAYEISKILDTGLDKKTLEILIALCETGVNPEACWASYEDSVCIVYINIHIHTIMYTPSRH